MKTIVLLFAFSLLSILAISQQQKPLLIGFNPSVTVEPAYPKGSFDLNIFPLVLEYPLIQNLDIRAITIANFGFRNTGSALINVGAEISLPYYFMFGKNKPAAPSGFFLAAGSAFTRNLHYHHSNMSVFFEPGYNFLFNDNFSLIIDLQYGRTFFFYDDGSRITGNHFGVKVILGWWI
jgi:hypothetical protein